MARVQLAAPARLTMFFHSSTLPDRADIVHYRSVDNIVRYGSTVLGAPGGARVGFARLARVGTLPYAVACRVAPARVSPASPIFSFPKSKEGSGREFDFGEALKSAAAFLRGCSNLFRLAYTTKSVTPSIAAIYTRSCRAMFVITTARGVTAGRSSRI